MTGSSLLDDISGRSIGLLALFGYRINLLQEVKYSFFSDSLHLSKWLSQMMGLSEGLSNFPPKGLIFDACETHHHSHL